ncbi:MAG TPA: response regulator [Cytophagaceae bacterium]|nr:response regulator [Cytophagaceae bacterium]
MINMVMLVDDSGIDNFVNKTMIKQNLTDNIVIKDTVKDALNYLRMESDKIQNIPDLIFLDINLPALSGFDFLKEYENLSESIKNKSKIIVLSSSDKPEDIEQMMSNKYVKDYLIKPMSPEAIENIKHYFL